MRLEEWTCRASQLGLIMTGNIGLTKKQSDRLNELTQRKNEYENGDVKKKLTQNMASELEFLINSDLDKTLPKTVQSELRNIYRQIKYRRYFSFTNKYVQKGNMLEESAITLLSNHLNKPFLKYSGARLKDDYFQGMPDIISKDQGFDTKCSWSLKTFPWKDDGLESIYEWQNQCYMHLTGLKKWSTVKCLVNCNQTILESELKRAWYSYNCPNIDSEEWRSIAKEIEKDMIFDFDQFTNHYPNYIPHHDKEEWNFDIPEKERIMIFESNYDQSKIDEAKERISICREYLKSLELL